MNVGRTILRPRPPSTLPPPEGHASVDVADRDGVELLDETSSRADAPGPGVDVQLHPHQLALLARCIHLERGTTQLSNMPSVPDTFEMRTRVGVIGDKAGAGKSFVMLALVLVGKASYASCPEDEEVGTSTRPPPFPSHPLVHSLAGNRVVLTAPHDTTCLALSLLVVPHNLCTQWEGYIEQFGGGLRYASISRTRHLISLREPGTLEALDLLVVTSTFYHSAVTLLGGRRVRRVLFDEADSLTFDNCVAIDAVFSWFATASYRNLLHPTGGGQLLSEGGGGAGAAQRRATVGLRSFGFIRNLFLELGSSALSRAATRAFVARNADAFVDASIRLPEPDVQVVRCKAPLSVRVLDGFVDNAVMRCLNAGDVESAMQHISPANRSSEDNVVAALMGRLGREVQKLEDRVANVPSYTYATPAAREAETQRLERRRDDLRSRMAGIRERVRSCDTCCICYDAISNQTVAPCCSNSFCFGCINQWISLQQHHNAARASDASRASESADAVCPLCKASLSVSDLLVVTPPADEAGTDSTSAASTSTSAAEVTNPNSSKLANLEAILRDRCAVAGRRKVLVFSSFENTFNGIVAMLERAGIYYRFLKGNRFSIRAIEREYREGCLDVLLVNTANYGSGLNLENTTDVVLLHQFGTDIEHQVIGRAQRYGRTDPLKVWVLLHENEESCA